MAFQRTRREGDRTTDYPTVIYRHDAIAPLMRRIHTGRLQDRPANHTRRRLSHQTPNLHARPASYIAPCNAIMIPRYKSADTAPFLPLSKPLSSAQALHIAPDLKKISMSSPNRNQYFNKQSEKVNEGLQMRCTHQAHTYGYSPVMNFHPLSFDLPLVVPVAPPEAESLIRTLLHPPPHAFPHGILSLQLVIDAVGIQHFEIREEDGRYIVRRGSILENMAARSRLPAIYWEWLCGGEESDSGASAAEMEVCLTREYFAELEIELWWEEVEREMEEDFDDDGDSDEAADGSVA